MRKLAPLLVLLAVLGLTGPASALTTKEQLVQFYQNYLALVSADDYVSSSRNTDVWEAKCNAIARQAGFEDAAAAKAAGDTLSASDSDINALRQAVAAKIDQQYQPYME